MADYNFEQVTILVAENDETNFIFYKEAFSKTKANIIWAKNGNQAVEMCKNNDDINIVIMDIQMPIMDGFEATEKIKKIKNIPVIVLTAYAMKSVKDRCISLDCDEFITKPVKSKELLEIVERYI